MALTLKCEQSLLFLYLFHMDFYWSTSSLVVSSVALVASPLSATSAASITLVSAWLSNNTFGFSSFEKKVQRTVSFYFGHHLFCRCLGNNWCTLSPGKQTKNSVSRVNFQLLYVAHLPSNRT